MENLIKIRKTFSKAMLLVYALVSIVACAVCMMLSHSDKAHVGIVMLVGFLILWVFTTISSICYFRQLDKTPAGLARYYMIHTLARFIVGGLIMLLLSSLANAEYKLILIGFCAVFILTLIFESLMFVHVEKRLNGINE